MSDTIVRRSSLVTNVHPDVRDRVIELAEAYWASRSGEGRLPARRDIDPLDIPHLMPQVILLDIQRDPWDFRFRLIGTNVVFHLSEDWTGRWMSAIPHMAPPSRIFTSCVEVAKTAHPLHSETPYVGPHRDFVAAEDVILPLAGDGRTADMLLVCVEHFEKG